MARYTDARCRQCRREGIRLYLKGSRCFTPKCAIDRRAYAPGQHGQARTKKLSDYGLQLREKQKVRKIYAVNERQFRNYFDDAERMQGVTGEMLLQLLERRLDNVVFRMGFASSRSQGRQLVAHGHFLVNGRPTNVPSYQVRAGDVIEIKQKSRNVPVIQDNLAGGNRRTPAWVSLEVEAMRGTVVSLPRRDEIDTEVAENLIIAYYSR